MGCECVAPERSCWLMNTEQQDHEPLFRAAVPIAQVRAWAIGRGLPVGTRGHIKESVIDAYNRRHRKTSATSANPWTQKAVPES